MSANATWRLLLVLISLAAPRALAQESLFFHGGPVRLRDALLDQSELTGVVCEDVDADHACSEADPPAAAAVVLLETGATVETRPDGSYRFRGVEPGEALVKVSFGAKTAKTVVSIPRGGILSQDFPLDARVAPSIAYAWVGTALAEASPGQATSELEGTTRSTGALAAQLKASASHRSARWTTRLGTGAELTGRATIDVPLNAGVERSLGSTLVGVHLLGRYYRDFATPSGSPSSTLVVAPTLSLRVGHALMDVAYLVDQDRAVSAGLGATYAPVPTVELAVRGSAEQIIGSSGFAERLRAYAETAWRPGGSALFLRYQLEADRRAGGFHEHTALLAGSLELIRGNVLRLSPGVGASRRSESERLWILWYALARLDARPHRRVWLGLDYRLQRVPDVAWVHHAAVDLSYELSELARAGLAGSIKRAAAEPSTTSNEALLLARLQLSF
jgi:hypothetical protein